MNAVLNVAVDSWYGQGSDRLYASLDAVGEQAAKLFWRERWPGKSHDECPFGFKVDAFQHAGRRWLDQALWLDASVWAVASLDLAWDLIQTHKVLLLKDSWSVGEWTSDAALEIYGITRDEAMGLPLCHALVVGVDLSSPLGALFVDRWTDLREAGMFAGPWKNENGEASRDPRCFGHRHDQSAASLLAAELGIEMVPRDAVLTLGHGGPDVTPLRAEGM